MTDCSSSTPETMQDEIHEEQISGAESGWVEAKESCDHLQSLSSDLTHIPAPDSHCTRCQHPVENWLCLSCKDVLCGRFVNKHMLNHHQETHHSLALSFSDLSVWCFDCDAYLDVQVIRQLQPVHEVAYLMKFGERPPLRGINGSHSSSGLLGQPHFGAGESSRMDADIPMPFAHADRPGWDAVNGSSYYEPPRSSFAEQYPDVHESITWMERSMYWQQEQLFRIGNHLGITSVPPPENPRLSSARRPHSARRQQPPPP